MTLAKKTFNSLLVLLSGALCLPAAALAQRGPGGYGMWNGGGTCPLWGGGWFGSTFMWIFWLVLLVVLVLGAMRLWKGPGQGFGGDTRPGPSGDSALDLLKRRYAAGEIDKEQYLSMKKDLE